MSKTRQTTKVVKKLGGIALASYVPGFFKIHLRYIRNYPIVWAALFVAPFLAIKMALINIFGLFGAEARRGLAFDVLAIFLIALCFYAAERHEKFRRVYVILAPAIVFISLIYWASHMGFFNPGFWVVGILIAGLTRIVWGISGTKGGHALDHGGSRKYAKAREFYDAGHYDKAVPLLEKAAKGKHFMVLYLLAESYELGHYFEKDLFKAAKLYQRSSKKGYPPALEKFQHLFANFDEATQSRFEKTLLTDWLE